MAQVEIIINGQAYRISCEDGQEQRLSELAQMVGAHVGENLDLMQGMSEHSMTPTRDWNFMHLSSRTAHDLYRLLRSLAQLLYGGHGIGRT